MTIALIALIGCTNRPPRPDPLPVQADSVGSESEPEAQQMRRRMKPPFADNLLGEGGVILDVPPSEEGRSPVPGELLFKPLWGADKVPYSGFANGSYPT